jgi:hypothetical protein
MKEEKNLWGLFKEKREEANRKKNMGGKGIS